ncbi:tRNA (guanine-N7-)-methyltransferase [Natranaerovirga pectinivora]|uniref:tRNA (guanine-N(7)-)-methyltransferase n=1 Tax=Natranaerovirga pectinivora TaxID=682400 RepID=A0A4R3MF09_9FIRM|nr:tRNA (guanosine(46)-N7)-methyltransferase TrmB [Natranaerovirga pectinivora]TCT12267.1 tRNA (guanine-N7-)-methyltransferase [Natranaerovirga pectinivora]
MRLRNVKGAKEILENHTRIFEEPWLNKGQWAKVFDNKNPIHIEIGMGKGQFISTLANNNPNVNYIGFEKYSSIVAKAIENLNNVKNNNLVLVRTDAQKIDEIFSLGEIERVYLNFSDPWPKDRHYKRRLTYKDFLNKYSKILTRDGEIHFKTDNKDLFNFSLEQLEECKWQLKNVTYDLHNTNIKNNVMTEYEEKFSKMGIPICRLEANK